MTAEAKAVWWVLRAGAEKVYDTGWLATGRYDRVRRRTYVRRDDLIDLHVISHRAARP